MCVSVAAADALSVAMTTVSLSRQERGLLKMHLVPQTAASSTRPGSLVIADMYGTGIAISNKLQVSPFHLAVYYYCDHHHHHRYL